MDFVGYFGFPSGEDPDTSSSSRVKPSSSTAASGNGRKNKRHDHDMHSIVEKPSKLKSKRGIICEVRATSDSEDEGELLALAQLKRPCLGERTSSRPSYPSSKLGGRKQLILKPCNRSTTLKSSTVSNEKTGAKKKPQTKRQQLDLHSFVTFSSPKTIPNLTNSAAVAVNSSAIESSDSTSMSNTITTNRRPFVPAASLLRNKTVESFNNDDLKEVYEENLRGTNAVFDECLNAKKSLSGPRVKISNEDIIESHQNNLIDNKQLEFTDSDSELENTLDETTRESSDKTRQLNQRRRNENHMFSIHSAIQGQVQPITNKTHSSQLLHGKGSTNILCHIFQRSILSSSRNAAQGMNSYIQSGKHWNVCRTVELDVASNISSGEICSMSFDQEGVLLATGDDNGFVRIYDFDDVNALDRRKRNERHRLQPTHCCGADNACIEDDGEDPKKDSLDRRSERMSGSKEEMETLPHIDVALSKPVLSFRCASYRITDIQWNPNNQDQLAVSFA
ncbi:hypothetical protein HJC23_010582 [Cyclotella cryptica]|uniref:Uncharacterized protein n=1 Tax=Cyclotella cryptica TaxID=29204 RepID=A0ABD3PPH7_9STRA